MIKKIKHLLAVIFDFMTIKFIYPQRYRKYAKQPINRHKVILLEPRFPRTTDSLLLIKRELEKMGGYEILEMSLGFEIDHIKDIHRKTMAFLREFATAAYVFTTDSNRAIGGFEKRSETQVIQCWHACGAFKRFGFSTVDAGFGGSRFKQELYPRHRNYSMVTVSSSDVVWAYEEAMGLEGQNLVKPIGVSRTDIFFDEDFIDAAKVHVEQIVPQVKDKKVILYAPTFRGRVIEAKSPDELNIQKMKQLLGDGYVLIMKHHPFVKKRPLIPESERDFAIDVTDELEIDELLCRTDICISDYSSLVFEFSLFERPMIFFAFDLEAYYDHRGFYYPYEEMMPGPIVRSTEEIIEYITNIGDRFDRAQIVAFREKFMGSCNGSATTKILKEAGII